MHHHSVLQDCSEAAIQYLVPILTEFPWNRPKKVQMKAFLFTTAVRILFAGSSDANSPVWCH